MIEVLKEKYGETIVEEYVNSIREIGRIIDKNTDYISIKVDIM